MYFKQWFEINTVPIKPKKRFVYRGTEENWRTLYGLVLADAGKRDPVLDKSLGFRCRGFWDKKTGLLFYHALIHILQKCGLDDYAGKLADIPLTQELIEAGNKTTDFGMTFGSVLKDKHSRAVEERFKAIHHQLFQFMNEIDNKLSKYGRWPVIGD